MAEEKKKAKIIYFENYKKNKEKKSFPLLITNIKIKEQTSYKGYILAEREEQIPLPWLIIEDMYRVRCCCKSKEECIERINTNNWKV